MKQEICPVCYGGGLLCVVPSEGANIEDWSCWLCSGDGLVDIPKLKTYEGLTELVKRVNPFRKNFGVNWVFREERDSPLVKAKNLDVRNYEVKDRLYIYNRLECCDCGLVHGLYIDDRGFLRFVPWRPKGFKYT